MLFAFLFHLVQCDIENPGLIEPSKCESCKFFTVELKSRLEETGKKKDVLRTGHGLDPKKKKSVKVTIVYTLLCFKLDAHSLSQNVSV